MTTRDVGQDRDDFREPHLRRDDFLGTFAVLRRGEETLFVRNKRRIHGREVEVWDLPGGQVEPGEMLEEALSRELDEEVGVHVRGAPRFLFMQEGERVNAGRRLYAWRSFFFEVAEFDGEPVASSEVLDIAWFRHEDVESELIAPYHDSYREWVRGGGTLFRSAWVD